MSCASEKYNPSTLLSTQLVKCWVFIGEISDVLDLTFNTFGDRWTAC